MRAIVIDAFGGAEMMHEAEVPVPKPKKGEVQIEAAYAGVNPVDWKIREGYLKDYLKHEFPLIMGWDVAGRVSAVGEDVDNLKVGDEVYAYCRKPVVKEGTYCEFVCFDAEHVVKKPKTLNFAEASGIPLVGLTAWQALFDFSKLRKDQSILIHAGAGGVGSMAIQLAKVTGAKIFTTASKNHHAYVKKLGADVAIDYHDKDFVKEVLAHQPDGVDIIFDCVGGETLRRSNECVKEGGVICTICNFSVDETDARGVRKGFVFVEPEGSQLKTIAELLDDGKIQAPKVTEFPLSAAAEALEKNRGGHVQGKLVLNIKVGK